MAERRHILTPYQVNGHSVRYSVRLRKWVVDELHYFDKRKEAFDYAMDNPKGKNPGREKYITKQYLDTLSDTKLSRRLDTVRVQMQEAYNKRDTPLLTKLQEYEQEIINARLRKFTKKKNPGDSADSIYIEGQGGMVQYIKPFHADEDMFSRTWHVVDTNNIKVVTTKGRGVLVFNTEVAAEKYATKLNRKKNPGLADEISSGFHGRKVEERFEVDEEELYPDNLAVLGCLVELCVICNGGTIPIRGFKNPYSPGYKKGMEVYVAAADRYNIEFVGGDQEIVNAEKIAEYTNKTLVRLGKVKEIVYLADKHHLVGSDGGEDEYEHKFGKKKYFLFGKKVGQPDLIYDCLNKTMKLVGGSYTITDEGIKD